MTETDSRRQTGSERATGLKIERIFTTPGVHPYDEVAWERRDVVQQNWKTGATVFEQRGVEFPDFWSVNASTIVTTKYFRGAVGTEVREWSLRQLVDRVVKTYRAAGEEHGYFATPDDAEIFEHELTHMLVHQVFSFNSPVWFNVGTASPAQVSACQPYHAMVSTPDGLVPIGKLVEDNAIGTKIYDAHGLTQILAVKANGVKDVLRLHLKAGNTLDVTADHLVWRAGWRAGKGSFIPARELQVGELLEWHRRDSQGEGQIESELVAEAALAGWLQSDGFVGQYASGTNRSLTIEAMSVNEAELAWITEALDKVLPGMHRHERAVVTQDASLDCRRTRIYGAGLATFVEKWNLRPRGTEMVVPPALFTAPLPMVSAYLRSIFQAEGFVSVRERSTVVEVDMVGEEHIRGMQALLQRFGIFARVGYKKDPRSNRKGCWTLRIQSAGDRRIFADEIGFVDPIKAEKLERSFDKPGLAASSVKRLEIARIENLGPMEVYDIQTESGEYLSGSLRVHNCFILSVDDSMDSILNWYKEEGFIFKGGSGAGLNLSRIRSSKELLSSGGTASGPVSFMRGADASAGTIKSGGATRRAAKMVVLDVDHPDIEEFVETKAREEDKIRALRDAGFDMDLGGRDIVSVQYQNANNSVRVTDEFMRAVETGSDFGLRARQTGEVIETVNAKELFEKIAKAAWECADPGIQYDDTINDWHTNPETGRITASNPCCFTGDTLVRTDRGPVPFELLVKTVQAGETVNVTTAHEDESLAVLPVTGAWLAGETRSLVEVTTRRGLFLRSTPEHRYLADSEWVEAQDLRVGALLRSEAGEDEVVASQLISLDESVKVYDLEVAGTHNFVVTAEGLPGVVVHNSEYMSLDNSSCNLASLNLLKFLRDDDTFDSELFARCVEMIITAMDISICFADFPTEAITKTTRDYRQLGIGYANLGALLMAMGLGYDSEGGRMLAAAITSLMTGTSYKRSAELAAVVGPYAGYERNAEPHKRVMRKHAAANDAIRSVTDNDRDVRRAAGRAWDAGLKLGAESGYRNAQASVLAPTGCLTRDSWITTDRGLVRLGELGDVWGDRWQNLEATVSTDEGPQKATQFFVNGEEPTRRLVTQGGYTIQGTLAHRIKIMDPETGAWVWRRFADIQLDDLVPLQMRTMVGEPRVVPLPVLDQAYYGGDHSIDVPDVVTADLAELVGYFMGDGSLHAKGIRLCVADTDLDVIERLRVLSKGLFRIEPSVDAKQGYHEVTLSSMRLARWWKAAGFAKTLPHDDHVGKGWKPRIPSAILETNDVTSYAAFMRGLFEADGTVLEHVPSLSTASESFAAEVRTLLLALGMATTTRSTTSGFGWGNYQVRLRNLDHAMRFDECIGFMSDRKNSLLPELESRESGNRDRIHLPRTVWEEIVPVGSRFRSIVISALGKSGGVSRQTAQQIQAEARDPRLGTALGYIYERVLANEDGGVQPTYDISVPSNVTYVANGFVSHNTISFMLDCDTTGVEPDFSLVKFKKLVGGGSMQIVNQTIPRALRKLGYSEETVEAIVEYIAEHGHVIDAPGLKREHYEVFDTAMGERAIAPMGHVRMMAATQPFVSGAISKTVNLPERATVEEIEDVYLQGWKFGLKALAVYRDNCKVGQPLSHGKSSSGAATSEAEVVKVIERPIRRRLPKSRPSMTTSFTVGGAEGYMTAGSYPDDGLGEVFLKLGKQGSTLAGVMDAFSMAISISLQYGVPLETYVSKFTNMKFEPAGFTDDPDVRMSQSIMDYIFRRLALDYLPFDKRAALGIYTADERQRQLDTGSYEATVDLPEAESLKSQPMVSPAIAADPAVRPITVEAGTTAEEQGRTAKTSTELLEAIQGKEVDAPLCMTCGTKMRPAGSCYVCEGCGSTSGCS